jgi:hypothetical protein
MPASVSQKITNSTTSYTFSTTKPSVTSTNGYTLIGWSLTSGGKNVDVALDGEITLSNSATLYAVWKKTLTLKYAKNGRGVMPDAQSCDIFNNETTAIFDVSNLSTTEIDGYTF